jgi:hypothetical protein
MDIFTVLCSSRHPYQLARHHRYQEYVPLLTKGCGRYGPRLPRTVGQRKPDSSTRAAERPHRLPARAGSDLWPSAGGCHRLEDAARAADVLRLIASLVTAGAVVESDHRGGT